MKLVASALCIVLACASTLFAVVKTEFVEYRHGDAVLQGFLAYDDAAVGKKPGILIAHEWWGMNDYVQLRAKQMAALGYVAFALDMYGKDKATTDRNKAGELAKPFRDDRQIMRDRALAGLAVLKKNDHVDPEKLVAMGYCFGGTVVLELARAGTDLDGVISFHGGLGTTMPAKAGEVKAKVLVLHGADDPNVPEKEVAAFKKEMADADVKMQLVAYEGAVHAFTNPKAGDDPSKGAAYNENADRESWNAMKQFLSELFTLPEVQG